ncbi:MAG: hypothetical protein H6550_16060 [Chitinophagales bacterium]|nr:hypothetical protein [Chitinophagales bacterium]
MTSHKAKIRRALKPCPSGKVTFPTLREAEKFCTGKQLRSYRCEFCDMVHVTSHRKNVKDVPLKYADRFKQFIDDGTKENDEA